MTEIAVRKGSLELLADLERTGGISEIGLHLTNPDLPYSQYEALCATLGDAIARVRRADSALKFLIGDVILLGEQLYGEEAFQAIESLDISEETRRECVRVSARVARSRRRIGVPWSQHRAVAALPPAEQKQWLKRCADENLSHHALRDELRNGEVTDPKTCRCCHRPLP